MDVTEFQKQLSEKFPNLNEQDKKSIFERVGLEIENRKVNRSVFEKFQETREKINAIERKALLTNGKLVSGPKCSFCYKHLSEVGFGIKASAEHVICESCIRLLMELVDDR